MEFLLGPPARVQPYFGYRDAARVRITARVLRSRPAMFAGGGRWQAFRTMVRQFASSEVMDVAVTLEIRAADGTAQTWTQRSDDEGFVVFDVTCDNPRSAPSSSEWETVTFHWHNRDGAKAVDGHVLIPGADARFAVISDIDDTIIETGITGGIGKLARNWRRILAELPEERVLVPGADLFYTALGGGAMHDEGEGDSHTGERHRAGSNPFFYISSSPWNLFSYLVAFQRSRGLPLGPMMLRDWALDRATLGSKGHGAHKTAAIERLLAFYPATKFVLIGDDTQGDLTAFGHTVATHPQRIRAVFVRLAGEAMTADELAAKAAIEDAGVPLWLGDTYATGEAFIAQLDLEGDREAETLVRTVEHAPGSS